MNPGDSISRGSVLSLDLRLYEPACSTTSPTIEHVADASLDSAANRSASGDEAGVLEENSKGI